MRQLIEAEARELHWNYTLQLKKNGREAAKKWIEHALKVTKKRFKDDEPVRIEMRRLERERREQEDYTDQVTARLLQQGSSGEIRLDAERLEQRQETHGVPRERDEQGLPVLKDER